MATKSRPLPVDHRGPILLVTDAVSDHGDEPEERDTGERCEVQADGVE